MSIYTGINMGFLDGFILGVLIAGVCFVVYLVTRKKTPQVVRETLIREVPITKEVDKFIPVPESERERILQARCEDLQSRIDSLQEEVDELETKKEELESEDEEDRENLSSVKEEAKACLEAIHQEADEMIEYYENEIDEIQEYLRQQVDEAIQNLESSKENLRDKIGDFKRSTEYLEDGEE